MEDHFFNGLDLSDIEYDDDAMDEDTELSAHLDDYLNLSLDGNFEEDLDNYDPVHDLLHTAKYAVRLGRKNDNWRALVTRLKLWRSLLSSCVGSI